LTDLHQIFDKDKDGALNAVELTNLFSTTPGVPWKDLDVKSITNEDGSLTLQGFLGLFSMTTLLNYKTSLSYFAYLGFFDKDTTKALKLTKSKKVDMRRGKVDRDVFLIYVFGAAGSGKVILQ
jgi:mitochondrial Rho GTPase 1